jgi:hypothetical protein
VRKARTKINLPGLWPWDTFKARREIRAARKLAERQGELPTIEFVEGTRWFSGEASFAVALREEDGELRCAIFLNASEKNAFKVWPRSRRFGRLIALLEAYFESMQALENYRAGIPADVQVTFSPSPAVTVSSIVTSTRFAYVRMKRIDKVLREAIGGEDGRPMTLARIDDEQPQLRSDIQEKLNTLPTRVAKATEPVTAGRSNDEIAAWQASVRAVTEVLGPLLHLAAAYDNLTDWQAVQARFFDNQTFLRFFADEWPSLHADWRASAVRTRPENTHPDPVVLDALKNIFAKLGITILDKPRGASILEFRPLEVAA